MMYAIQLDMYQAAAVAALVLLLGRFLVRNLDLLRRCLLYTSSHPGGAATGTGGHKPGSWPWERSGKQLP